MEQQIPQYGTAVWAFLEEENHLKLPRLQEFAVPYHVHSTPTHCDFWSANPILSTKSLVFATICLKSVVFATICFGGMLAKLCSDDSKIKLLILARLTED